MRKRYKKIKTYYNWGGRFLNNPFHSFVHQKTEKEIQKTPSRTEIINFLLNSFENKSTTYLEIGVRNPSDNFNHIKAHKKYSVDPGVEFKENPVDFKLTSNEFFQQLKNGKLLKPEIKFNVIFIDGLHLADQVDQDIKNALNYISEDGFIVLHDCNPPTEWHAREEYLYDLTPAMNYWTGTTWKAFVKATESNDYFSCCIDSDWGVGVINKKINFGKKIKIKNDFFEFHIFDKNRKESLNLLSFESFKQIVDGSKNINSLS